MYDGSMCHCVFIHRIKKRDNSFALSSLRPLSVQMALRKKAKGMTATAKGSVKVTMKAKRVSPVARGALMRSLVL